MPGTSKVPADDKDQSLKSQADHKQPDVVEPVSKPAKEQEPAQSVEAELKEVQERDREADKKAEKEIKEVAGEEARLKEPEPELPADVQDAGVVSPQSEAAEIAEKGGTIDLPISKETYEEGQHTKLSSKVTVKKEVYGVKGIVALALFVGRLIKRAHHHTKKVIFKGEK